MSKRTPLKAALEEAGISQVDLARELRVGESQVSKWANGILRPGRDNRAKIARVLGRSEGSLFPWVTDEKRSSDTEGSA